MCFLARSLQLVDGMIPEKFSGEGWTEYAKVNNDYMVTVKVSTDFNIASIKWAPEKPRNVKLMNQGIVQWVKSPFRHTMFLQHFLRDVFNESPQ